ncbi:MAG: hypothetical protein H6757_07185 [Candidatus Omnitrophica bacterium]|nr:hypothetical protein [Candidatus Omnitrophota bacterium]
MPSKISVAILTSKGYRHSYFCHELAKHFRIKGIFIDDRYHFSDRLKTLLKTHGLNPIRLFKTISLKRKIRPFERRDALTEKNFFTGLMPDEEFPHAVPVYYRQNPNDPQTRKMLQELAPDVVAVFGTRLIKDSILETAKYGALNIHTGLSPYYRGGQCTFWCLYHGDVRHVGVTIHHLTRKIDGGDIIVTAQPEIISTDTVRSIECKLVQLGTQKMIAAIENLVEGTADRVVQTEKGKLFLSKMFTLEKRLEFEERMKTGWLESLLKERGPRP